MNSAEKKFLAGAVGAFVEWVQNVALQILQQKAWKKCPHCAAMVWGAMGGQAG